MICSGPCKTDKAPCLFTPSIVRREYGSCRKCAAAKNRAVRSERVGRVSDALSNEAAKPLREVKA